MHAFQGVGFHSDTPCLHALGHLCRRALDVRKEPPSQARSSVHYLPYHLPWYNYRNPTRCVTGTTSRQPARPPFGTPPAAPTKPKRVWKQRANDSRGDANLFSLWSLSVSRDTRGERGERGVARVRIYRCGLRQHPDTAIVHYVSCRIAERRVVRGRCESKFKALSNVYRFQDFTAHAPIRLPS